MSWTLAEPQAALDPELDAVIRKLGVVNDSPVNTLAARSWHYAVQKQRIVYQLSRLRKCTLLEEFIFKATAMTPLEPVDTALVAELLGLDQVFIESVAASLGSLGLVESEALPDIRFTANGRTALDKGEIIENCATESLEYYFDRKFGSLYAKTAQNASEPVWPAQAMLDKTIANLKEYVNKAFVLRAGAVLDRDIERPDLGQTVSAIVNATVVEPALTLMSEIWTWDAKKCHASCLVWDHARQVFNDDLAAFIENTPGATDLELASDPGSPVPAVRWRR